MADNYDLLVRLLVGVLKHQAKRHLGEDILSVLAQAGSQHLGERLLDILRGEAATCEQAKKLSAALKSAAEEVELGLVDGVNLRFDDVPPEIVNAVVEALANLESGDLYGRRLQSAIQDLVAGMASEIDADISLGLSMQLYQAVLMVLLTIPELRPRAQDLLHQSRTWLLSEQIRKIELITRSREEGVNPYVAARVQTCKPAREAIAAKGVTLKAGRLVANGSVELVKRIGQGGQGSVWQGRLIDTRNRVAVKFLNEDLNERPEFVHMFEREVRAMQALSGESAPNIVCPTMFEDGRWFYVMDQEMETMSLAQLIESNDVPVVKKLNLICEAAGALHAIHQQGFVHGDVKPENIIIKDQEGVAQLIDFASVRRIGQIDAHVPITFTFAYAAPELLRLRHTNEIKSQTGFVKGYMNEVGPSLDIYPLGVMLLLAVDPGLGPLAQSGERNVIDQLLVNDDLKAVIRKAMAHKPSNRFRSALEFKLAVEQAIRSGSSGGEDSGEGDERGQVPLFPPDAKFS